MIVASRRRARQAPDPVEMTRRLAGICVELNLPEIEIAAGEVPVRVTRSGSMVGLDHIEQLVRALAA